MNNIAENPRLYKDSINAIIDIKGIDMPILLDDENAKLLLPDGGTSPAVHGTYIGVSTSGSGIKSPLTESAIKPRTYFEDRYYVDSAGLLCYIVKPLKDIYFKSADNKEVKFILKEPPTPTITP